jgi:hypothetical protein
MSDAGDLSVADFDIGNERRVARAVHDTATTDEEIGCGHQ